MDYVPPVVLQQMDRPPRLQLSKCYYIPQLEGLKMEMKDVEALGHAAAEEWYKGLEDVGRRLNADAARLDQWELQGGLAKISQLELVEARNSKAFSGEFIPPRSDHIIPLDPPGRSKEIATVAGPSAIPPLSVEHRGEYVAIGVAATPLNFMRRGPDTDSVGSFQRSGLLTDVNPPILPHFPSSNVVDSQGASQPAQPSHGKTPRPINRTRPGRTPEEVERTKAERRKEIERRSQELVPPILPPTLEFMDAFQAALHISLPMDDTQWAVLKPRLLGQKMDALRKQNIHERRSQDPAIQLEERQLFGQEQRVAQENVDHMWSELKVPSRDKLGQYARKFIHNFWSDGNGVTKGTSSKFAAEVLCHIRQQFEDAISQEDKVLDLKGTAFPQDSASLALRRLKLDDMKWAFEAFVKPHTDKFGKDLFLCSVCDNNQKLFSFEAVIQHYAAKHTHNFSRGNAVVYWKAEWPLEPPFDPSPNIPWVQDGSQPMAHMRMQGHYAQRAWTAPSDPVPTSTSSHQGHVNEVVNLVRELWYMTDGVHNLPEALRLSVVIQLTCSTFSQRFNDDLGLHLFLNCVQNRPELDFLIGVSGLQCSVCSSRLEMSPRDSVGWFPSGRSLSELLTHFQRTHIDFDASSHTEYGILSSGSRTSTSSTRLDWRRDMILLPSRAEIQAFLHSPSNDSQKVQIIADALNAPAYTVPNRAGPSSQMSLSDYVHSPIIQQSTQVRPMSNHGSIRASRPSHSLARSEVSVPASEDEYDPHRPGPPAFRTRPLAGQSQVLPSARPSFQTAASNSHPLQLPEHRQYPFRVHCEENRGFSDHDHVASAEPLDPRSLQSHWTPNREMLTNRYDLPAEGPRSVESRPASKTTSHHSIQRPPTAEASAMDSLISSQAFANGPQGSSAAAIDFLNNFDPTAVNGDGNSQHATSRPDRNLRGPTAHEYQDPRQIAAQESDFMYAHRNARIRPGFEDQHIRPGTPPSSIRESGRFGVGTIDHQSRNYFQTPSGRVEEARDPRSVVMEHGYEDELSGTFRRPREASYTTRNQEQVRNYQEVGYERNAYYEGKLARPVPRYEVIAQPPMEVYQQRREPAAERFVEVQVHRARQQMASDGEEYMSHRDERTVYVPVDRRYYDQVEEPNYAQPVRERQVGYTNYNDAQYVREGTLEAGPGVHANQRDLRPHLYRPDEENRHYMTR